MHLYNKKSLKDIHNRKIFSYISKNRLIENNNIYDIDSFSKALILSLVWNSMHSLINVNSRYYFNPYTLKLEPITTDQYAWSPINGEVNTGFEGFTSELYLDILSNESYLNNLSMNIKKVEDTVSSLEEFLSKPIVFFEDISFDTIADLIKPCKSITRS